MNLFKQIAASQIELKDFPFGSELSIEAFIVDNPQVISNNDFIDPEIINQQLSFKKERGSKDGRIDLLAKTAGYLIIIEVKKGILNQYNLDQLLDYLDTFNKNSLKDAEKYHNHKLIGLLVGIDITNEVKSILYDGNTKYKNIVGLTLKRFKSIDSKENYILTESYQSKSNRLTRFKNWKEFRDSQSKNGIPESILLLAQKIHDDFTQEFNLTKENINYAPNTFTLNVVKVQRKTVFAYIILRKKDIKIYLTRGDKIPHGGKPHENLERYKDSYFVTLSSMKDYTSIKEMIRDSYRVIDNYYE